MKLETFKITIRLTVPGNETYTSNDLRTLIQPAINKIAPDDFYIDFISVDPIKSE